MARVLRSSVTRDRLIERLGRQATVGGGHLPEDGLLTTGEVAMLFRVSHRAVRCWAEAGKLPYIRTLGGHRRFPSRAVWGALRNALPIEETDRFARPVSNVG